MQLGTGGFAGMIFPGAIEEEIARGNAVAMSDSGHVGDRMSAAWAAGAPTAVVDYGHRSIKATSDAARLLIRAFYGRPARYRYFVGCSNGGRQALVAAQRYPDDWEGILAGSPANPWSEQLFSLARLHHALGAPDLASLPLKLAQIQHSALAQCPPHLVKNGVATDPRLCHFAPGRAGLTPRETAAVRAIVAAGYEPTSAAQADGWSRWIVGTRPGQLAFAEQAYRYLFQSDPRWSVANFDPIAARRVAQKVAPILDATADFGRFRARGGKILSYFGWADPVIAPRLALRYYEKVLATNGRVATPGFYRLFMIPGMGHCQGGTGPVNFGQTSETKGLSEDADHDVRVALESWVERGRPPALLLAVSSDRAQQAGIRPVGTKLLDSQAVRWRQDRLVSVPSSQSLH